MCSFKFSDRFAYVIRSLQPEDRAAIIDIVKATGNFNSSEIAIADELVGICLDKPEQVDYFTFVATDDESGRVAGFLIVGPTPATSGTFDMYWIASHPDFYGRGVSQSLDKKAVDFVRERGGYLLIAETSSLPAYERTRAFYAKQGYDVLSRIADYYKPGDDLVVYGKRIG